MVRAGTQGAAVAERATPLTALWITLLAYTVFTISRVHAFYPVLAPLRPILVLFLLAVLFAAAKPQMLDITNVSRQWQGRIVIALGVLACFSALFGISLGHSAIFIIENYGKTIVYCCMLTLAIRDWQDIKRLAWAYVIAAGIIAYLSLVVFGLSKEKGSLGYDANDVALVVLVALPLSILTFQTSRVAGKIVSGVTLVGIVATIARSTSRGGFLGLVVVAIALLLGLKGISVAKRVFAIVIVAVALSLGARGDYWETLSTIVRPKEDYNWDDPYGRRQMAKRGMGYMLSYPAFGIGTGNFDMAEGTISEMATESVSGAGVAWRAAHNSYVQMGAEMGIPGILLWIGLLFGSVVGCYRLRSRMPKHWLRGTAAEVFLHHAATAIPIAMLGFATSSFFVSHAYSDEVYVLAALVCGLHVEAGRRLQRAPETAAAVRTNGRRQQRARHNP